VKTARLRALVSLGTVTLAATIVTGTTRASATPAAATPAAATPAVCNDTVVAQPAPTPFPAYGPRVLELWIKAGELGDWAPPGTMRPAGYLGLEVARPFDAEQRFRLSLGADVVLGHWGDDAHSLLGLQASLAFRWSFAMDDIFDSYLLARPADFLFTWSPSGSIYRPGIGLGVRVARAVQLEATADALVALDGPFADRQRAAPGLDITLGFDLCLVVGCNQPSPPQATQKSLTCNLYNEAQSVCGRVPDRAALCAAVFAAMDANRPLGPEGAAIHDPIDAFLLATQELVADSAKSRIADLRQMNTRLLQELGEAQEKERRAAQGNTWLSDHCAYAPTAIELRDAFGCTAQGTATAQCPTQPVACL
jgi:hypothetical protein